MYLAPLLLRATGLACALAALATPALAQFAQYTPPGGAAEEPGTRKEKLDHAIEAARWRLGAVRVEPWFGLREIGYVDDAPPANAGAGTGGEPEGGDGQATVTAGAGFKAYLPTGPKVVLAAHAMPEYLWAEEESLRRTNGRYGVGFFGFFNRLTAEATATRTQQLDVATPELLRRADTRADQGAASLELNVLRSLYVFAGSTLTRVENLADDAEDPELAGLSRLDREEQVSRAGLRLRSRGGWLIGLGVERSDVEFEDASGDRSNSGTAPVLELAHPEGRLQVAADVAWRSLEAKGDAPFVPFDGVTGSLRLGWGEGGRLQPALYVSRNLVYALDPSYSYLESDRYGLSLGLRLGHRTLFAVFAEAGTDDYQPTDLAPLRNDDQLAYGASAALEIGRSLHLSFGWSREEYDSNLPGRDRELTVVRGGLTLGRSPSPWY